MHIKNIIFSVFMLSLIFSNSFAVAYDSGNPAIEVTKVMFGMVAGGTVIVTGAMAGGTVGMALGAFGGAIQGAKSTDTVAGMTLGMLLGGVAGAAAGGTAGAGIGLAIVKAFYDETEKRNDKNECNKKEELKEALHKKN